MTSTDALVDSFISGERDKHTRVNEMDRIMRHFGYEHKKGKKSTHRKYVRKGKEYRNIYMIVWHKKGSSQQISTDSIRDARDILAANGLLYK